MTKALWWANVWNSKIDRGEWHTEWNKGFSSQCISEKLILSLPQQAAA